MLALLSRTIPDFYSIWTDISSFPSGVQLAESYSSLYLKRQYMNFHQE